MPRGVHELLDCWKFGFGRTRNLVIWEAVPHFLLWCIWMERNDRCFEGRRMHLIGFECDGPLYLIGLIGGERLVFLFLLR